MVPYCYVLIVGDLVLRIDIFVEEGQIVAYRIRLVR